MVFFQFLSYDNFSYLLGDDESKEAAVVDPPHSVRQILAIIEKHGLRLKYIINTHSHCDHTSGNERLVSATGANVIAHRKASVRKDIGVEDGGEIQLGTKRLRFIHTPGHSPDGLCILFENKLLTGDTLFVGECGRTDLIGGSSEDLYASLFGKLLRLDDSLEIWPGHNYGPRPSSTLGYERRHNYTLRKMTKAEFVEFMKEP